MQDRVTVGVFGASGYAGIELVALLAEHPNAQIGFVASDRWVGTTVEEATGIGGAAGRLRYVSVEEAMTLAPRCIAVMLATPAESSIELAPKLAVAGCRVIDLSGAFRLRDRAAFTRAYATDAAPDEWLARSVWGLPELARERVRGAAIIANPGCYPTAAVLALGPLLRQKLIEPSDIVVDALSGVSGAGRRSGEEYGFMELHADARAYKVLRHQHTPEIAQGLAAVAGAEVDVTFTPHLVPLARGILSTAYARLSARSTAKECTEALREAYRAERFVRVVDNPDAVSLRKVVGTNDCLIGVTCDEKGRLVAVSAIDNLLKGAAGQALQNLNLALGWEEAAGLHHLRRLSS
jgi:N-acetyl-gamma-glutamyl-phosphate reductase